jgi:cell division protein FtsL
MKFVLKLSSLTAFMLALLAGGALFWVSQQVQQAEREQRKLQGIVTQEQEAIRVLNAEWDYLNRPDRLERLAEEQLKMEPAKADDLLQSVRAIPEPITVPFPPRDRPVFASTASAPVAKVATPKPNPVRDIPVAPLKSSDEDTFNQLLETLESER